MEVLYVDSNFFSVFSFPLLFGNTKNALLEPNSVVLSEDEAKKQFGTVQALGKTILLKDKDKFQPYSDRSRQKMSPELLHKIRGLATVEGLRQNLLIVAELVQFLSQHICCTQS